MHLACTFSFEILQTSPHIYAFVCKQKVVIIERVLIFKKSFCFLVDWFQTTNSKSLQCILCPSTSFFTCSSKPAPRETNRHTHSHIGPQINKLQTTSFKLTNKVGKQTCGQVRTRDLLSKKISKSLSLQDLDSQCISCTLKTRF